jgi:hypothetical protein
MNEQGLAKSIIVDTIAHFLREAGVSESTQGGAAPVDRPG